MTDEFKPGDRIRDKYPPKRVGTFVKYVDALIPGVRDAMVRMDDTGLEEMRLLSFIEPGPAPLFTIHTHENGDAEAELFDNTQ